MLQLVALRERRNTHIWIMGHCQVIETRLVVNLLVADVERYKRQERCGAGSQCPLTVAVCRCGFCRGKTEMEIFCSDSVLDPVSIVNAQNVIL